MATDSAADSPVASVPPTSPTALVTGAGRNIGRGIALALAADGTAVAVNDLNPERAQAVADEITAAGGTACAAVFDVTDYGAVEEGVRAAVDRIGRIDILVNNAGVPEPFALKTFREMKVAEWDRFLKLNLYGVLHCVRAVADGMCEAGWGRVVTIVSEAWRVGTAMGISMYGTGKAGAVGFTRHLACELAADGVTANCISLGEMDNLEFAEYLVKRYPTGRLGSPDDVAATVRFLVSNEAAWLTGQTIPLNGGLITA